MAPGAQHWELQLVKERGRSIATGHGKQPPLGHTPACQLSVWLYLALGLPFSGVTVHTPCEVEVM